jgi:hypothetical protein
MFPSLLARRASFRIIGVGLLVGSCTEGNRPPKPAPSDSVVSVAPAPAPPRAAPHGGTLVSLGAGAPTLEFVYEPSIGKLTLFLLDSAAANPIRLPERTIAVTVQIPGRADPVPVTLLGVASDLSGETEDNTSVFAGREDVLRGLPRLAGQIPDLTVGGVRKTALPFSVTP